MKRLVPAIYVIIILVFLVPAAVYLLSRLKIIRAAVTPLPYWAGLVAAISIPLGIIGIYLLIKNRRGK